MFLHTRYVERCVATVESGTNTWEQAAQHLAAFLSQSQVMSRFNPVPAPETEAQLELYRVILRSKRGSDRLRETLAKIVSVYS